MNQVSDQLSEINRCLGEVHKVLWQMQADCDDERLLIISTVQKQLIGLQEKELYNLRQAFE